MNKGFQVSSFRFQVRNAFNLKPETLNLKPLLIPHPSSLILLSVSAKELLNVWLFGFAQRFVCAAEDNAPLAHHQNF